MKNRTDRRSFLRLIPAVGLAAKAFSAEDPPTRRSVPATAQARPPAPAAPQQGSQQAPLRLKKESLHCAEELMGIELTDAQETMVLPGADRNLANYETLRKISVPLDAEPAFTFRPAPLGKKFPSPVKRFLPGRIEPPSFKSVEDLAFSTTLQLAELVRTRRVSSRDLTKMYLDRLKRYGPRLNCVVTLTEELAFTQAEEADSEIRQGKYRGPLHGIPWGAKDIFATKDIPTTWGAEPFRNQVFDYDAAVVERLRAAGAVLVAKLSMGELAAGGGRWFKGMTRNPWNPEETTTGSSGSSAGSAAATSAGLVGFSLGTETLGSIIAPCSRCGVTGLRPTFGRVSRYGTMGLCWSMDKIGPICRDVEDCAAVLYYIYGPDGRDAAVGDVPFAWNPAATDIKNMRIGYLKSDFEKAEGEQKKVYGEAFDALLTTGANLQPMELPRSATPSLRIIATAEAASAFDDITRNGEINALSGQSPNDWPNLFRTSRFIPAVEYLRAQRVRTLLIREMDELMSRWDVFFAPAPTSASSLITNLTGHPAVVVPCGFAKGQPQAMVFIGRLCEEATPLRVALAFERATKWHTMHPEVKE